MKGGVGESEGSRLIEGGVVGGGLVLGRLLVAW